MRPPESSRVSQTKIPGILQIFTMIRRRARRAKALPKPLSLRVPSPPSDQTLPTKKSAARLNQTKASRSCPTPSTTIVSRWLLDGCVCTSVDIKQPSSSFHLYFMLTFVLMLYLNLVTIGGIYILGISQHFVRILSSPAISNMDLSHSKARNQSPCTDFSGTSWPFLWHTQNRISI